MTSGTPIANTVPGEPAREGNATVGSDVHPRAASEEAAASVAADGVNVSVVRLPQVHDTVRQGLITPVIEMYREKGACAYVGDGLNRWPAAYILDVAGLYRLAIEKAEPNAKYQAVAEEGVPMRDIAEAVGRRLKLPVKSIAPEEAQAVFGWLAMFAGHDMPASSAQTRKKLGWQPTGPGLIADLEQLRMWPRIEPFGGVSAETSGVHLGEGVTRYQPTTDKIMRLHAQTAMIENGFVHIPETAPWLAEYLHEMTVFPKGKHDDQADSTAQFLDWYKRPFPSQGYYEWLRQKAEELKPQSKPPPAKTIWAPGSVEWLAEQKKAG